MDIKPERSLKSLRGLLKEARRELTREWARRGLTQRDEYRALTNLLMERALGMDVARYRRYKNLQQPRQSLRDYMTDLELVLTNLGESAAIVLHRQHDSHGFDQLRADVFDAGEVVARAKYELERRGGGAVVSSGAVPTRVA